MKNNISKTGFDEMLINYKTKLKYSIYWRHPEIVTKNHVEDCDNEDLLQGFKQ